MGFFGPSADEERRLAAVDAEHKDLVALARLFDTQFGIPGTPFRFGLDSLVGLVPVAGDVIGGAVSLYLVGKAKRAGASNWLVMRMLANTAVDSTLGAVPVVGDVFDVMFRANTKNIDLLRQHLAKQVR